MNDLHTPEKLTAFAAKVDEFEKHDRCGDYHLAVAALREAIHLCPFSSVGSVLATRLQGYKTEQPFNFWTTIRNAFGRPNTKIVGIRSSTGGTAWVHSDDVLTQSLQPE